MALNEFSRWNLIREASCSRKTGTLVLQIGQSYISWSFCDGNLRWISSTHPDYTLTQFLLQNQKLGSDALQQGLASVNDSRSLGAALFQVGAADTKAIQEWTAGHAAWLCPLLLQGSSHIYWADRLLPVKPEFVHHPGVPLSRILLSCERTSVEVRSAFQFSAEMPHKYRVDDPASLYPLFVGDERRVIPYLKRADSLEEIYTDPDLDRLTCCRILFLLWIAGRVHPVAERMEDETSVRKPVWLRRARSVPPDWIIPLVVGILLGVLFGASPQPTIATGAGQQHIPQIMDSPAWRSPDP